MIQTPKMFDSRAILKRWCPFSTNVQMNARVRERYSLPFISQFVVPVYNFYSIETCRAFGTYKIFLPLTCFSCNCSALLQIRPRGK